VAPMVENPSTKHPLIRLARETDIGAMAGLLAELFAIEADFEPDTEKQTSALAMLLESDTAEVLVADIDGEVIGMCTMQRLVSTAEGGWSGLIEDVIVAEGYRGRGIGTLLLQGMTRRATAWGIGRLQLLADDGNSSAHDFYASRGWHPTGLHALRHRL